MDVEMTLTEHLAELRFRLLVCLVAVVIATIVAFIFIKPIMRVLMRPANVETLYQLSPTEGIFTFMRVALMVGIAASMPVLVYQIGAFVLPGLTRRERRYLFWLVPSASFAFVVGVLFGYFVVLPFALQFLLETFAAGVVQSFISVDRYVSFVTRMLLALGIVFETPIFIYFLSVIGLVDTKKLARWRPYVVVLVAVIAAVITPTPDPFNQALVGIPMYLLYEVGILLSRIVRPSAGREANTTS